MTGIANNIHDCYTARIEEIKHLENLKRVHKDRKFLATLDFTEAQLQRYDNVVCDINTRLQIALTRKQR